MAKLIALTLLQTCIIGGLPRSPVEGVQMVPEDEAKNFVESGMAEMAEVDTADDDGDDSGNDGLDRMKVADLKALAEAEGIAVESDANKAATIAAIREGRAAA